MRRAMIEPSESARRVQSAFRRFGVPLEGELASQSPDAFTSKRAFGGALLPFVDKITDELGSAEVPDATARILRLRLKQLRETAEGLMAAPPSDRFEPAEFGVLASFVDVFVHLLGLGLGKEYRADSP